jgi:hypothetical protein
MRVCAVFLALILIFSLCSTPSTLFGQASNPAGQTFQYNPVPQTAALESKKHKLYLKLDGDGKFLTRDGFKYLIPTRNFEPFTIFRRPNYTIDSFGAGGKFTLGWQIDDKSAVEWYFQGTTVENDKRRTLDADVDDTDGIVYDVPVIDARNFFNLFGITQTLLIAGSPNVHTKLEYDSWYVDTFVGYNRSLLNTSETQLNVVGGPAYAHFNQEFVHSLSSFQPIFEVPASGRLKEDIDDDLVGIKVGVSLSHNITRKFQITGSIFGGGYYRWSKLEADQTLTNAVLPFTLIGSVIPEVSASKDDHDYQLVPRFESNLEISYRLSDQWKLGLSGGVDIWGNMSNVQNPKIAGPSTAASTVLNGPVRIDDDDTLIEYRAGVYISFRH